MQDDIYEHLSKKIDSHTQTIASLEKQIADLQAERDALQDSHRIRPCRSPPRPPLPAALPRGLP